MNNYHKILAVAVFGILIIPQITLAAWWNPFTWNIFSSSQPSPQIQVISTTTSPDNFISTSTSVIATTSINIAATSTTNTPTYQDLVKTKQEKAATIGATLNATQNNQVTPSIPITPICPQGYNCAPTIDTTSSTQVPIISSFTNGTITGQHFTGVTAVYLYSIPLSGGISQRIDFNFVPQSDTTINTSGSYNVDDADKPSSIFKLYVANAAGVSTPVEVNFSSTGSSQTTANAEQDCLNKVEEDFARMLKELNDAHTSNNNATTNYDGQSQWAQLFAPKLSQQGQAEVDLYDITSINNTIKAERQLCQSLNPQVTSPIQSNMTGQNPTDIYGVIYANLSGSTVYGSNGGTYSPVGGTIYGPGGTTYTVVGNTIYGPNNTTYRLIGSTLYGSDGTTYIQTGNTISGSDGSSATESGNTMYVQSGNK